MPFCGMACQSRVRSDARVAGRDVPDGARRGRVSPNPNKPRARLGMPSKLGGRINSEDFSHNQPQYGCMQPVFNLF